MNTQTTKKERRTVQVDNKTINSIRKYVFLYSNKNKFVGSEISTEEIIKAQRDMKERLKK